MNVLRQVFSLASTLYPGGGHRGVVRRWKHIGRSLIQWPWTGAWYCFLDSPALHVACAIRPRLYTKLQRPYLTRRLGFGQRLEALQTHYSFAGRTLSEQAIAAIYRDPGMEMARLALDEGRSLVVRLGYSDRYEKEGDLSLAVFQEPTGIMIYTVTFSVTDRPGIGRGVFIGGLQGGNHPDQPEIVRQLTKDLYGMRPKAFALFLAQQFVGWIEARELRAVSDAETIYRHFQNRKTIEASYDALWSESGGTINPADGCFDLPPHHVEKAREDIKTSKRSLYEKRYGLLRELALQLRAGWESAIRRP